jgi:hypothetical protein
MAKLSISRLLETSKLLSTKAGQELREALVYLNDLADQVLRALRQGLTFEDNFKCTIVTVSLQNNVESVVYTDNQNIFGVLPIRVISTSYGIDSTLWFKNSNNELVVKLGLSGSPTEAVQVQLIVFYV